MPVQSHAQTNKLKDVNNTERAVALVCTQLAMIGMVNCDQGIDMGIARGLKLLELQLALIGWKHTKVYALQTNSGLPQVDQLNSRDRLQDFGGGLHDARHAWVFVQSNSQFDPFAQMRTQTVKMCLQEQQKGRHPKRPSALLFCERRQSLSRKLKKTAWAPEQALPGFGAC